MKKLLIMAIIFTTTSAFAFPSLNYKYENPEDSLYFDFSNPNEVNGEVGANVCGLMNGKLIQKTAKDFIIKIKPNTLEGLSCGTNDTIFKGKVLATKNNKVTKFKILQGSSFQGVYTIAQ